VTGTPVGAWRTPAEPPPGRGKWRNVGLLALAELLAMTLWFSASAVVPQIAAEWSLGVGAKAWLTMSVQIGFVTGALVSAVLNLADRVPLRVLIGASALIGAAANGAIALVSRDIALVNALRFVTGMTLAGVYPPGMKLVVTWCRLDRGLGIGVLIAALTVGSAMPHAFNGFDLLGRGSGNMPDWRSVVTATSVLAVVAAFIVTLLVRVGPHDPGSAPFDWRYAGRALAHRPTRLANYGYLGHMWELYAMWTWVPAMLIASFEAGRESPSLARLAGFAVIAIGSIGCVLAGVLADRFGRTLVAGASLLVSGLCAAVAGLLFAHPWLLTLICLVWGFAVVADSAQFSAAVSELSEPRYIGTALTVQTCLGFLLTLLTIRVVPAIAEIAGWERVFLVLVPGPAFGLWSMIRLRRTPEARRMANGAR
jgi:MFS family permease